MMSRTRNQSSAAKWTGRLTAALFATSITYSVDAQEAGGSGIGGPGSIGLSSASETLLLDGVTVSVKRGSGDAARDRDVVQFVRESLAVRSGDRISTSLLAATIQKLEASANIREATARFVPAEGDAARARLVVEVSVPAKPRISAAEEGATAAQRSQAFPSLWRNEDGGVRFILNGGLGAFTDGNPWFGNPADFTTGNPLVQDPPAGAQTDGRIAWFEQWIEAGIGGAIRLGSSNAAIYGVGTVIAPFSTGQDIFRDDTRSSFDVEKAYMGFLWSDPGRELSYNLSVGRLNFSLNDGFLISQFGSQWNAGPRPSVYLAPRTTHDLAAVGTLKSGPWTAVGFYLDPNEYEPIESDTTIAGANLRYNFTEQFYADATVLTAPTSKSRYSSPSGLVGTRDGLTTYAGHVRWADRSRVPGLWLEGEIAHQRHDMIEMDAWAGYATVGYLARDTAWTPSISYRVSGFSGDDPVTDTYERFDALYSGGLSEWLQGISIGKVLRPENRISHRVRLNVQPNPRLNLTLDYVVHRADELNNFGALPALQQLKSDDLGEEVQFVARWAVSDKLYFQGVASVAFPGEAIRAATTETADRWTTLQAQLFWTF